MPIYEYRCTSCPRDFELTRPVSQSSDPGKCPTCGKPAQKLVSSFASKADYTVKVPSKEAFRAPLGRATATATKAPAKAKAPVKAKAPAKGGAKKK